MQTCDTLLHAGVLLTQDDDRRVLENAALAIDDGRIVACASHNQLLEECPLYAGMWAAHIASRDTAEGGVSHA